MESIPKVPLQHMNWAFEVVVRVVRGNKLQQELEAIRNNRVEIRGNITSPCIPHNSGDIHIILCKHVPLGFHIQTEQIFRAIQIF